MGIKTKKTIELTIGQQLDKIAQEHPKRLALIVKHQNVSWSYSEYHQRVSDFSAGLLAIGIKPGDRVAIWAPNSVEWCIGQYATAKIGAIMVCINPAYGLHELLYALKNVGCKALITAKAFKSSNYLDMLQTLLPELENNEPGNIQSKKLPLLTSIIRMGMSELKACLILLTLLLNQAQTYLNRSAKLGQR